jgi:hypothetical protein
MSVAKLYVLLTITLRQQYKEDALLRFHGNSGSMNAHLVLNIKQNTAGARNVYYAFPLMMLSKEPHMSQTVNR